MKGPLIGVWARPIRCGDRASQRVVAGGRVAATSAKNAWAVGYTEDGFTFIVHWDGTAWRRVPSPSPGRGAVLTGVTATSARNAWAVGITGGGKILILRWNGTAWTRAPAPDLPAGSTLNRVTATSASNAWAVGYTASITPLILRWNGTGWKRVPSPKITGHLYGITAIPRGGAWAAGLTGLPGAAAGPALRAWAPGMDAGPVTAKPEPLILRWNGRAWKRAPSPAPVAGAALIGLTSTSATSAWAVGGTGNLFGSGARALVLHWNGHAWKPQKVIR